MIFVVEQQVKMMAFRVREVKNSKTFFPFYSIPGVLQGRYDTNLVIFHRIRLRKPSWCLVFGLCVGQISHVMVAKSSKNLHSGLTFSKPDSMRSCKVRKAATLSGLTLSKKFYFILSKLVASTCFQERNLTK